MEVTFNQVLIESYFHSTHRGVSSGFSPSLVADCFKSAKVPLDARRLLCLSKRRRALYGFAKALKSFSPVSCTNKIRVDSLGEARSVVVFRSQCPDVAL